jgi:AcrR family transcriptional regulator
LARQSPRQRLLDAVIAHVAEHGISDLSLRELAAAVGTSHRMLIHHFGGKDGLRVAVVQEVEARQRAAVLEIDPSLPLDEAMRAFWRHISDPALWGNERLFFELYGQALQGRTKEFLDGIVDSWVEPAAQVLAAYGVGNPRAVARLGVAVTRGLLLDLLATADRQAVDAAMEEHIAAVISLTHARDVHRAAAAE